MKVKIVSIHNQGNYDKEYVLLRVDTDCDIGRYLLADSTYTSEGKISNKLRHTYWFPDKNVKKGELVSLWTRTGTNTVTKSNKGETIHRFYWGLKSSVWNDEGDSAVLLEIGNWQFFRVE